MKYKKKREGFTLIELLVVISIIGLLASMAFYAFNAARIKARDVKRLADLKQISTAIELYYDENGYYPREAEGSNGKVGEGGGLDTMLAPYMSHVPYDPLGPGDASYNYYYDGRQYCTGHPESPVAVIFARTMEAAPGNSAELCSSWGGEGGAGSANAYHIIFGPGG